MKKRDTFIIIAIIIVALIILYFIISIRQIGLSPGDPIQWGFSGTTLVPGDYNGDGIFDLAVYDRNLGDWYIRKGMGDGTPGPTILSKENWGFSGAVPVPGDYNNDGTFDLAVYDLSSGNWYIMALFSHGLGSAILSNHNFGFSGAVPVPGDYNGDGNFDLAVFDKINGKWYIEKLNPDGSSGGAIAWDVYNNNFVGKDPVPGDYNGDGKYDLAVYKGSSGDDLYIYSLNSDGSLTKIGIYNFGSSGDKPAIGDYDGDGTFDIAIYNPSNGNFQIMGEQVVQLGVSNIKNVYGDYNGDGIDDFTYVDEGYNWQTHYVVDSLTIIPSISGTRPCTYGLDCTFDIRKNIAGKVNVEVWYTHIYSDNSRKDFCFVNGRNPSSCTISGNSDQFGHVVNIPDVSQDQYYLVTQITDSSEKIIRSVEIKIAVWQNFLRSPWSEPLERNIVYNCIHECPGEGATQCSDVFNIETCSNHDSDSCLEWGSPNRCELDERCTLGFCVDIGAPVTCTGDNKFCKTSKPSNSQSSAGNCVINGYSCYQCNSGFIWDIIQQSCVDPTCTNTCGNPDGTGGACSINNEVNGILDQASNCCGAGSCYLCSSGYHAFNGDCVLNTCIGTIPSNNIIKGPETKELGNNSWVRSEVATETTACMWRCSSGYHWDGTICAEGVPQCSTDVGCSNISISNATTVTGNCSSGYSCYDCIDHHFWDSDTDKCVLNCPRNKEWNGYDCVSSNSLCNGCVLTGDDCVAKGYRIKTSDNQNLYCSSRTFQNQKTAQSSCENNYECISNDCSNGKCLVITTGTTPPTGDDPTTQPSSTPGNLDDPDPNNLLKVIAYITLGIVLLLIAFLLIVYVRKKRKNLTNKVQPKVRYNPGQYYRR